MDVIFQDVFWGLQDIQHVTRVLCRLLLALVLGGIVGLEREHDHKSAGIRTHMLVALGAALFSLMALECGMQRADLSRVVQGVAAGIGFIGAGTILKHGAEGEIRGLTTAASIWLTAAVGLAVGAGSIWPATIAVFLAWFVLYVILKVELRMKPHAPKDAPAAPQAPSKPPQVDE